MMMLESGVRWRNRAALIGLLLISATLPIRGQACDAALIAKLPLTERTPIDSTGQTVVVMLTGDGGWAHADQELAVRIVARGGAVVGLNMRSYLGTKKAPDQVATDVSCIARQYLYKWRRTHLIIVGYSRGADIAPFVATRLKPDLRSQLDLLVLASLSLRANFQFHLLDLVRDVRRDDDVDVLPELEKLRGTSITCVYGTGDDSSGCRDLPAGIARVVARDGGHRIEGTANFAALAAIVTDALRPARK